MQKAIPQTFEAQCEVLLSPTRFDLMKRINKQLQTTFKVNEETST